MLTTSQAGDRVADRYLLQEPIGSGGMGVVWLAWDETLQRRVAVKCARPDDDRSVRRLRSEARNAARLHHPNIVGVFDFVEEESACWIVMEYVPSRSLAQLMRERGVLSPQDVGSVGGQIAAALAKSHAEGVVHGDVTPENILVTDEGTAKLTDFGISRALWSEVTQTTTGAVGGKPRYLAPEVARGRPAAERADVFSLGASLFAAVEGQSPYGEVEHVMAYVARAIEGHIEPTHRAGPLAEPLIALLEVEPRRRPSAIEARKLLVRAVPSAARIQEEPREGRRLALPSLPSLTLRLPRSVRRRRRPLAVAVGALITAAAVTAGVVVLGPWAWDREGGPSEGKAKPSAPAVGAAGTLGDPRTADPCALLDAASLSRFGDTERDPDYGEFDRCDVLVRGDSGEDVADLELNFSAGPAEFEGDVPIRRVGNVKVGTFQPDGDECVRIVATADRQQIVLIGKRFDSPAPDPCELADAATDRVVGLLDQGQVPRRSGPPAATSLVRADACALLDATALRAVPGVEAKSADPSFGDWDCEWETSGGEAGVDLEFSRDNTLEDDGEPVVIAGRTSYVSPRESGDDSCVLRTPHRSYTNAVGDDTVELFLLTVYGPQPVERLCDAATTLAATATKNIAKTLSER